MGRGSNSEIRDHTSWFVVIIINITVSGLLGIYVMQEIHWLQKQVIELSNPISDSHPNTMGITDEIQLAEYYNLMSSVNIRGIPDRFKKRLKTNKIAHDSEYKEDKEDNGNEDTALESSNQAQITLIYTKKSVENLHNKVKYLDRRIQKAELRLLVALNLLDDLNNSFSQVSQVKSAHYVAKPLHTHEKSEDIISQSAEYSFWHLDRTTDDSTFSFDTVQGSVTVNADGIYLVYAQVTYRPNVQQPGYTIVRETRDPHDRHLLDSCTTIPNHTPGPGKYIMCSTVTVARLGKGDVLYIAHSHFVNQSVVTEAEKTFWGIVSL